MLPAAAVDAQPVVNTWPVTADHWLLLQPDRVKETATFPTSASCHNTSCSPQMCSHELALVDHVVSKYQTDLVGSLTRLAEGVWRDM